MQKQILFCVVFAAHVYTYAQTDTPKIVNLGEVVKTATKFEQPEQNVIQQVRVLTNNELRLLNAQTSADVLQLSGSALVQKSQQGGGSPILRGFEASRVLLVIDGVRMNNILYRSGHLQNVITVDNNVLDRIEVLYGPSSTMYGSDALGGVVHLQTRNPILSTGKKISSNGQAMFRYGSVNEELTGHLAINLGTKRFASLTAATFSRFGDLRMGNYTNPATAGQWERNHYQQRVAINDSTQRDSAFVNKNNSIQIGSGYHQYDILQKFLFQPNDKISHILNLQFSNSSDIPRYDRLSVKSSTTVLRDAEWYYGPQRRVMAAYDFNFKNAGPFDQVNVGVNYQNIQESRHSRGFGSRFRTSRIEDVNVLGYHANFLKKWGMHQLQFGSEGQFNFLKSTAFATDVIMDTIRAASTRYPDGKNQMHYIALYAAHTWNISKQMVWTAGLRYNFVTLASTLVNKKFFPLPYNELDQTYHAASGNLGLNLSPGQGLRISVLAATGFRAPNVDDISKIFDTRPGTLIVPNKDLKPEYTINGDLTIEKTIYKKLRLSVTAFYTYFFNAITIDKFQFNGEDSVMYDGTRSRVYANQNKGRAYIVGVSAMSEVTPVDWLTLFASVNYTHGRIITDTVPYPLDHIAPVYGRAGFTANYKWLSGQFFALFSGQKELKDYNLLGEDNLNQATPDGMPAWYTFNVRVGIEPVKNMRIDIGCDNMLDVRYRVFASGISAPGRNIFVSLRAGF